jgi:hypothetical protein
MFDTYGNVQLKITQGLKQYSIGDPVPLADGVYCGVDGFIVVHEGKFVQEHQTIFTTYATEVFPAKCLANEMPWLSSDGNEEG